MISAFRVAHALATHVQVREPGMTSSCSPAEASRSGDGDLVQKLPKKKRWLADDRFMSLQTIVMAFQMSCGQVASIEIKKGG